MGRLISDAPGYLLDRLRRIGPPNPEGSHLDDGARLHLVYMLGAVMAAMGGTAEGVRVGHAAVRNLAQQLGELGMPQEELLKIFDSLDPEGEYSPFDIADKIAVHPSLRHAGYLD